MWPLVFQGHCHQHPPVQLRLRHLALEGKSWNYSLIPMKLIVFSCLKVSSLSTLDKQAQKWFICQVVFLLKDNPQSNFKKQKGNSRDLKKKKKGKEAMIMIKSLSVSSGAIHKSHGIIFHHLLILKYLKQQDL